MYDKNAFCKGVLCRVTDRKYKSFISNKKVCGKCSIKISKDKYITIDELFLSENIEVKTYLSKILKDEKQQNIKDIVSN